MTTKMKCVYIYFLAIISLALCTVGGHGRNFSSLDRMLAVYGSANCTSICIGGAVILGVISCEQDGGSGLPCNVVRDPSLTALCIFVCPRVRMEVSIVSSLYVIRYSLS
jgi:hypothetical protein